MEKYTIIKYYQLHKYSRTQEVIKKGQTLIQAQEYCSRPDTEGAGWFCGFVKELDDGKLLN